MSIRWNTFEPGNQVEELERQKKLTAIESWWRQFESRTSKIEALFKREDKWDLASWMLENLQAIESKLMWEFGPGLSGGHRLIVTPESDYYLRPFVDEILRLSPEIEGWTFYGHRLPESLEQASSMVESRSGVGLAATSFRCQPASFNLIDVIIEFPGQFLRQNEQLAYSQAFILIESLLGEATLNTWIGAIDIGKRSWFSKSKHLENFAETIDHMICSFQEQLPGLPALRMSEDSSWSLFETKPVQANDYPARTDILVGTAMNAELWQNAFEGTRFSSGRYSRTNETFCYLKIDGSEGLDGTVFDDRSHIEDTLIDALLPDELGGHIGGGTGLRYSYIDLAITDLSRALPIIRQVLQSGRLTKRSWLLFFDTEWQNEWYGIWPDSPMPPMASEYE